MQILCLPFWRIGKPGINAPHAEDHIIGNVGCATGGKQDLDQFTVLKDRDIPAIFIFHIRIVRGVGIVQEPLAAVYSFNDHVIIVISGHNDLFRDFRGEECGQQKKCGGRSRQGGSCQKQILFHKIRIPPFLSYRISI